MNRWFFKIVGVLSLGVAASVGVLASPGGEGAGGCHVEKATGDYHFHEPGTRRRIGDCERDGDVIVKTLKVEVVVKAPSEVRVVTKEIKHVRVKAFEAVFSRKIAELDAAISRLVDATIEEAARPPRVVRVDKLVPMTQRETSEHCAGLRVEYLRCADRWGCDQDAVVKTAIAQGCL